jgi:hypothetical protein
MDDQYQKTTQRQQIPQGATADDIGLAVKAILKVPFHVDEITINGSSREIVYSVYLPKTDPPDGMVLDPLPQSMAELLAKIDIKEIPIIKVPKINMKSLGVVSAMLMNAGREKMTGVGWVLGSVQSFCRWMGIKGDRPPVRFMGIPIIQVEELSVDRLLLLCARSVLSDPLDAEIGFSVAMDLEVKKT